MRQLASRDTTLARNKASLTKHSIPHFVGEMRTGLIQFGRSAIRIAVKKAIEMERFMRKIRPIFVLIWWFPTLMCAQENHVRGARSGPASVEIIELNVPAGTPLPVVLDKEVRIKKTGQEIHGKIAQPVYVFDKLVVPAGSDVVGKVTRIGSVPAQKRVYAAFNSDFSPARDVEVTFNRLVLAGRSEIPLHTHVSLAPQGVLEFTTATEPKSGSKSNKQNAEVKLTSEKVSETKKEVNREWNLAKEQIAAPGKLHRVKRMLIADMPVHPQYIEAGTRFNAELIDSLNFGTENKSGEELRMIGTPPPPGSIVHARLETPLSSATVRKGDPLEAVITDPLVTDNQLVLPEGTLLKGTVLQVRPARRLHRNGQLRIIFREIVPPNSAEQKIEGSLEGVEASNDANLSLDSEGGAKATTPKTRYLTTGLTLALAAASFYPDSDAGSSGQSILEIGRQGATGASGFRVVGFAIGLLVHSRPLACGFGAYGAAKSIYSNFLSRGHEVVYVKDSAMAIGFGSRVSTAQKTSAQN
jgi:hypothetical protein